MDAEQPATAEIERLLALLRGGDESAREGLIEYACERLRRLTRKLKSDFPVVGRWEQTDDVFQGAVLRLHRSLQQINPENSRAFFGLAATQIRRELIDLARKLKGPMGIAANYATDRPALPRDDEGFQRDAPEQATDAADLERWTEFHQQVEGLSEEAREVFDLCYYQGLSQAEAAVLLGVSTRTVKRRFQAAKLQLHERLAGNGDP